MSFIDKNRKYALDQLDNFNKNRSAFSRAQSQGYVEGIPGGVSRTEYHQTATDPSLELLEDQLNTVRQEIPQTEDYLDQDNWFIAADKKGYELSRKLDKRAVDVARYLTQKASEVILGSNTKDRDDANQELLNIERIKEYKKGYLDLDNLRKFIVNNVNGDPLIEENFDDYVQKVADGTIFTYNQKVKDACQKYKLIESGLKLIDEYFKTEGRQSDIVSSTMFSYDNGDALDKARIAARSITQNMERGEDGEASWFDAVTNIFQMPFSQLGALSDLFEGTTTSNVVKGLKDGDPLIDHLYKGSLITQQDVSKKLKETEDYYNRFLLQNDVKIKADIDFYREGILHPSVLWKIATRQDQDLNESDLEDGSDAFGVKDWNRFKVYNPEDISEEYKKAQLKGNWKIWRPDYWIPEQGSNLGLGVGMLGSMGASAVAKLLLKHIPVWLASGGYGLVADIYTSVVMGSEVAAGIGFAKYSREMETACEAANGMASRIVQNLLSDGLSYEAVMSDIKSQLKDQWKIDTRGLKPEEIILLAIAYNIQSENTLFNAEVNEARNGLGKLINANNSLAYVDYLGTMPFTHYGGSFLRSLGNTMARGAERMVSSRGYRLLSSADAEQFAAKTAQDQALRRLRDVENITGRATSYAAPRVARIGEVLDDISMPLVLKFKPEITAVFDNIIERSAIRAIEKGGIASGLRAKHIGEFVENGARNMFAVGISEGIEEGNQEILQNRYKRGEYDNYKEPYSIFNIPEMFRDVELSANAVADFFGINFGDPDNASSEVRRAMAVGFLASLGLPMGRSVVSNILSNEDNIRGLVRQLKTDSAAGQLISYDNETLLKLLREVKDNKTILKMVGDALGGEQDDARLGIFFDAFHKVGATPKLINKALNDYISLVGNDDLVSKRFIEDDRLLMNAAYSIYNNKWIQEQLKKDGFEKYGEEHRNIVRDGARYLVETAKTEEMMNETRINSINHRRFHNDVINKLQDIEALLVTNPTEEKKNALVLQRDKIFEENPYIKTLYEMSTSLYESSKNNYLEKLRTSYDEFIKNSTIKKFIQARQGNKKDGPQHYREFEDVAKEIFADEELKENLISLAQGSGYMRDKWSFLSEFNSLYHDYRERLVAEKVLELVKDQEKLQSEFVKSNGLDINTKKLKGIVGIMQAIVDTLKKGEKKYITENLQGFESLDKLFENISDFADLEDYEANLIGHFMNSAAYEAQATVRNAYLNGISFFGKTMKAPDADVLSNAVFGEDSERNSAISEFVKRFKKLNEEYKSKNEEERTTTDLYDIEKTNEEAAWALIKHNLSEREKHARIAHRIYEEDRPIHSTDIDAAIQGNEQAQLRVQGEEPQLQPQPQPQPQPQTGSQNSLWGGYHNSNIAQEVPAVESEASKRSREQIENANLRAEAQREAAEKAAEELRHRQQAAEEAAAQHHAELGEKVSQQQDQQERQAEQNNPEPKVELPEAPKAQTGEDEGKDPWLTTLQEPEPEPAQQEPEPESEPIPSRAEETPALPDGIVTPEETNSADDDSAENDLKEQEETEKHNQEASVDAQLIIEQAKKDVEELAANAAFSGSIRPEALDVVEGNLTVDGRKLDEKTALSISNELSVLIAAGQYDSIIPRAELDNDGQQKPKELGTRKRDAANYVGLTFFYDPTASEPISLRIGGRDVKLAHPIAPNGNLGRMLLQEGWFESSKKYYIVTLSLEAANNANDPDSFTVAMVIDDGKNSYVVTLRQLGVIESAGKDGKKYFKNHEQKLRMWLGKMGTLYENLSDEEAFEKLFEIEQTIAKEVYGVSREPQPVKMVDTVTGAETPESIKAGIEWGRRALSWYTQAPVKSDYKSKQAYEEALETWKKAVKNIREQARRRAQKPNAAIMTLQQIDQQIDQLRSLRNEIINAVLTKNGEDYIFPDPENTYPQSVEPKFATRSNGVIKSQRTDSGQPIFRRVAEGSIEEITQKIDSGELVFGIGLGYFSKTAPGEYKIRDLGDTGIEFNGKGYSGKIYLMVPGRDGNGNTQMIPVMLSESRFATQEREVEENGEKKLVSKYIKPAYILRQENEKGVKDYKNQNVVLTIDPVTNEYRGGKYKPSAAEVLLYLICGRTPVGDKFFGKTSNPVLASVLSSMFINHGEITLLNSKSRKSKKLIAPFALKQIAWYKKENENEFKFRIALPTNEDPNVYEVAEFTEADLFGNTDKAENNRKLVVSAIATQMHWNTEESHMTSKFSDELFAPLISALKSYFTQYDEESISIFGCPQLTFNREDFFDDDMALKGNLSMLAWMIKTGRLVTDTQKEIFQDPFVFANGVKSSPAQQALGETKQAAHVAKDEPVVSVVDAATNVVEEKVKHLKGVTKKFLLNTSLDARKATLDYFGSTQVAKDNDGVKEVLAVDVTESASKDPVKILNDIKAKVDKYAKDHGISDVDYSFIEGDPALQLSLIKRKKGYPIVFVYNNGKCLVRIQSVHGNFVKTVEKGVTGVFLQNKSNGKFNEAKTRRWLRKTLGLTDKNVIVLNGVMKSAANGKDVYGMVSLSLDELNNLGGDIVLSREGGKGVHYHEAWHYVNLLLHDAKDRAILYKEYEQYHPELKGKKYKEIEEAMAEDFRAYMEMRTSYTPSALIKRLFDDVKTLIGLSRNKTAYRYVYKQIRNGRYAGIKLNHDSVREFAKRYPKGAEMQGYIPGVDRKTTESLDMADYHSFYDTAYAIVNHIIDYYAIDSIEQLRRVSGKNFKETLKLVKTFAEEQTDPAMASAIMSVYENPLALYRIMLQQFGKYGINVRIKSFKNEQGNDNDEAHRFEEGSDENQYDKFDLSISSKENVALKAKMFMSRIPVLIPQYTEYEENGKTKRRVDYIPDIDPFGNPKVFSFDEVWVAMTTAMHNTDSFDKVDENGHYLPNSTLGICERAAKTNPMFISIMQKLQEVVDPDTFDILLKQSLQATINRSMPHIQYVQLSDAREMKALTEASMMMNIMFNNGSLNNSYAKSADRERTFDLFNDNRLHVARNIARKWSRNAILKGLAENKDGKQVVSEQYVKGLLGILGYGYQKAASKDGSAKMDMSSVEKDSLMWYMQMLKPKKGTVISDSEKIEYIENIQNKLVELLNYMGIEADQYSVNTLLNIYLNLNGASKDTESLDSIIAAYLKILRTTGSKKGGDIIQTINLIVRSVGKEVLDTGEKDGKPIEDVFNRYGLDTEISKLALSWNATYPSSQEFSLPGPNGDMLYPVSQNNFISDIIRWLNNEEGKSTDKNASRENSSYAVNLRRSDYARHSIVLEQAINFNQNTSNDDKLKLFALVGMKDTDNSKGADYFGITTLEDYLIKMCILESDHLTAADHKKISKNQPVTKIGQLILPTMADKKTYYSFGCKGLKLSHDAVIRTIPDKYYQMATESLFFKSGEFLNDQDAFNNLSRLKQYNAIYEWAESKKEDLDHSYALELTAMAMYNKEHGQLSRFSDETLNRFVGYFEDELRSLISYYSEDNVKELVKNKWLHHENFHGKVKNGRLQFGGNGGNFRYFYDTFLSIDNNGNVYNMNHYLLFLWNLLKDLESGKIEDPNYIDGDLKKYIGSNVLGKNSDQLDGFELIREYLDGLKKLFFGTNWRGGDRETLRTAINRSIMKLVDQEMEVLSSNPAFACIQKTSDGRYLPYSIPRQFLQNYADDFERLGISPSGKIYQGSGWLEENALYSLIANHMVNNITSMIEYEKLSSGDPAFTKWKGIRGSNSTMMLSIDHKLSDGTTVTYETSVDNIYDKFSDKIKRFGGQLSPGDEVSLFYNKDEIELDLQSERPSYLNCTKYTNLNIEDLNAMSLFIEPLRKNFMVQTTVDILRSGKVLSFEKYVENKINDAKLKGKTLTREQVIGLLYSKDAEFKRVFDGLPLETKDRIEEIVESQIDPYTSITVADAQVIIRPSMYRKIRIGLGEWSFEPDEHGYSDEIAFNILENDDTWMTDPVKASIVGKFQAYPLKMSYYQNEARIMGKQNLNLPMYGKQAIFAMFKFNSTSEVARKIYDRMNKAGNELDMISFKSAVKIGATDYASSPIEKDALSEFCYVQNKAYGKNYNGVRKALVKYFQKKGAPKDKATTLANSYTDGALKHMIDEYSASIPDQLSKISDEILKDSQSYLDYKEGIEKHRSGDVQPVQIQDLKYLRMQLNTKAHEAEERAIGTQMFKIAFSNIIDGATYCEGKSDRNVRTGRQIKRDIMGCINTLTYLGAKSIMDEYYQNGRPNRSAIGRWIKRVISNNGLGTSAEEIINNGGVIASLMSRKLFEQTVSSAVNRDVVNINTHGGTAIQQSSFGFGFTDYGNANVRTLNGDNYVDYNGGEELKWDTENGSMEVILSMNFFKPVVPKEYLTSYSKMRQWLIDNDVIKGTKLDGTKSNPKPFGVGYRIPTQGMSSMFAFTVADVLPEQNGDVIIVPREFTAQTGSDFDVDKLFLATLSYVNGKLASFSNGDDLYINSVGEEYAMSLTKEEFESARDAYTSSEEFKKKYRYIVPKSESDINSMTNELFENFMKHQTQEYVTNRLILNYIDIISDRKNYGMSRASIDVITEKIKKELLVYVQDQPVSYIHGMFELTPSFQAIKKLEFGTGKDGIGPFALNITHLALTLYTHLSLDYGELGKIYGLGDLDLIYGEDDLSVAGWLSAMVNAHVDVAKDPYVFAINVNKETYNHANFLIRAGKGLSTFTFLAQPILKRYATQVALSKSIYGSNIEGKTPEGGRSDINAKNIQNDLIKKAVAMMEAMYAIPEVQNKLSAEDKEFYITTRNYFSTKDKSKVNKPDFSRIKVFDQALAIRAIKGWDKSADALERYHSAVFLLYTMYAYTHLNEFALKLADLVHASQIDTKKFGNNITSHINFCNSHNVLINSQTGWIITTDRENTKDRGVALKRYFNELYLNDKLGKAVKMTKEMLLDWTFTATDDYEVMFKTMASVMFGQETVSEKDKDGKLTTRVIGYKEIKKDDTAIALGNGIDNTMRYNALIKFGYDIFKRNGGLKQAPHTGMIDFTMGGDKGAMLLKVYQLFHGDPKHKNKNIMDQLFNFVAYIKANPESEYAEDLINEDGVIVNEVLKYFQPMPANQYDPIGRITLLTSLMNMDLDKKSLLMSAMYQLLTHPSERVRELTRDLILYGYYSTYDQNTRDAFLDIVPYEFRKQYDLSLAHAIRNKAGNKKQIENFIKTGGEFSVVQQYLSVIARNYWYDDEIVPRYFESQKTQNVLRETGGEVHVGRLTLPGSKYMFPGAILSSYVRPGSRLNPKFMKIRKGDVTVLYKNVGEISVGDKKKGSYSVYIAIPKAGIHQGHIKQFEMYADYSTMSIFDENKLPESWAPRNLVAGIRAVVDRTNKQGLEEAEKNKQSYSPIIMPSIDVFADSLPEIYEVEIDGKFNSAMYYEVKNSNTAIDGIVRLNGLNANEDPKEKAAKTSDVVIEIDSSEIKSKSDQLAKKTVSVSYKDGNLDISKQVSQIAVSKLMSKTDLEKLPESLTSGMSGIYSSGITINITGDSNAIPVSKLEIEDYVTKELEKFNAESLSENTKALPVKNYEEYLRQIAEDEIRQQKADDYVVGIVYDLLLSGVKIALINTSTYADEVFNKASIKAAKLIEDYLVYKNATVYAKKSDFRSGVPDELYEILRYGNDEAEQNEGDIERQTFIEKMNNVNMTYRLIYDALQNAKEVLKLSATVLTPQEQKTEIVEKKVEELKAKTGHSFASMFNSDITVEATAAAQREADARKSEEMTQKAPQGTSEQLKKAQEPESGRKPGGSFFRKNFDPSATSIAEDAKAAIKSNNKPSNNCK